MVSKPVSRTVELPGEFLPFLSVSLHAKVPGYVERVLVDRGSVVKQGDLLVELSAPEMTAQIAEAESKVQAAEADRLQAEAQLAAAQSTYERMKKAAETPGAIAGNELIQAEKQVDAAKALLNSRQQASRAAEAAVRALKDLQAYLKITAPFDGVVTDRLVHPGALVGSGQRHRASGDPAGVASAAGGAGAGGGCRRHRQRRERAVSGARLSGANLLRSHCARCSCARSEDAHHGRGAGRDESRRLAGAGHVSGGEMAGAPLAARALRSEDQRGHHHRAHVRDPRPGRPRRMGRCAKAPPTATWSK